MQQDITNHGKVEDSSSEVHAKTRALSYLLTRAYK